MKNIQERFRQFLASYKYIYIFGAGFFCAGILEWFIKSKIPVQGLIVTRKDKDSFMGISVYEPDGIEKKRDECGIVFALSERHHESAKKLMEKFGYCHFFQFTDQDLTFYREKADLLSYELLEKYQRFLPEKSNLPDSWRNILVIRLDGIGDVVLNVPFLRELKRNHPFSHITLIVAPMAYPLMEVCPYVDRVVAYDWKKNRNYPLSWRMGFVSQYMKENFRNNFFDVALLPRFDIDGYDGALLCLFSRAPYRLAYSEKVRPLKAIYNKNYDRLFSCVISSFGVKHEVLRNLDMISFLGDIVCDDRLELWSKNDDNTMMHRLLDRHICEGKILVAIGIGGSNIHKKWNIRNYLHVIDSLHQWNERLMFLMIGDKEDGCHISQFEPMKSGYVIDLTGKITLRMLVVLMKKTVLYLGNDTGAMHIAAACGCNILELSRFPLNGRIDYVSSDKRFSPWTENKCILSPRNGKADSWEEYPNCIQQISIADVIDAVKKMLNSKG